MKIKLIPILFVIFSLTACRGNDDNSGQFAGTWRFSGNKTQDTCNITKLTFNSDHFVTDNDNEISLRTVDGDDAGSTNSEGGFTVQSFREEKLPIEPTCPQFIQTTWKVTNIADNVGEFELSFTFPTNCIRKIECKTVFRGSVQRISVFDVGL